MNAPTVLLTYQQAWLADQSPVKVWEKSRRIGASWCQASDSALLAAAENGMDSWYVGYNREMAQEFIRDTGFWARHYQLAAGEMEEIALEDEDKDIVAYRVTFASGKRVTALSSRPSNLRGKQGMVIIDEAAFHEQLDELLKAALALLIWGGRVVILSTHDGDANPFNELIGEIRAGKKPYSLHRTTFDDALEQGLFKRICLKQGLTWTQETENTWRQEIIDQYGSAADEELFCIPSHGSGVYFTRALLESIMDPAAPVIKYQLPDSFAQKPEIVRLAEVSIWLTLHVKPRLDALNRRSKSFFGMDFGRSGDLSVIAPLVEDQGLKRRMPFLIELRNIPFRQQEQILFFVVAGLPRFMGGAMDARGNGQYLAEVAAQKFGATRIAQVMLTQGWYLENFPKYRAAMEDKNTSLPKDADVLDDHRAVTVEKGIPKLPEGKKFRGADGGQRHGDTAIAGCLAWFANGMNVSPIEFQTLGQPRFGRTLTDYF